MLSNFKAMTDQPISQWMQDYGDGILRSCLLLCGNPRRAHFYARSIFIQAYEAQPVCETPLFLLLEHMLRICPCRIILRTRHADSTADRFMQLSPSVRKAALLCLYHGLDDVQAAALLKISPAQLNRRLETALKRLREAKCFSPLRP